MAKSDEKADVWMPLYIGDYLADTSRLTTEQHGAYFLLMMDYWRNGPPPDDEEILQNITRLSKFLWKKHGPVLQKFFTVVDDVWRHKRLDEEISKALTGKASASEKGRAAAQARWGKSDAHGNAQAYAQEMHEDCPSSSPSSSPSGSNTSIGQSIVVGTNGRAVADSVPKDEAEWLRHMRTQHGFIADERSVHDRKRYWGTFAAWANAGITTAQVDAAVAKARAESTEPIANIVAYASRVLDSMSAQKAQAKREDTAWKRSDKGIESKASELGIYARAGESHDALRERCEAEIRRRAQNQPQGAAA